MKITNDQITLDPEDIAQFSKSAQAALAYPENGQTGGLNVRTYQQVAETAFNQALQNGLEIWRKSIVVDVAPLLEALKVETDPGKKAQAEALIDQAKTILDVKDDVVAVGLNPSAEPAVPKK